jgi:predicted NACHT family NTPase
MIDLAWTLGTSRSLRIDELLASPPGGIGPSKPQGSVGEIRNRGLPKQSGTVRSLYDDLYIRLGYGQIILTGPAGAGKTAAMLTLMLEYLSRRKPADPVPIWLSMGNWDPRSSSLQEYAAAALAQEYPASTRGPGDPRSLVEQLWTRRAVALFLDGLDDMSPETQAEALKDIDGQSEGIRITLTCSLKGYDLARSGSRLSHRLLSRFSLSTP